MMPELLWTVYLAFQREFFSPVHIAGAGYGKYSVGSYGVAVGSDISDTDNCEPDEPLDRNFGLKMMILVTMREGLDEVRV